MPSSHQHVISSKGTRSFAERKWRHVANASVRQMSAPAWEPRPKPKRPAPTSVAQLRPFYKLGDIWDQIVIKGCALPV